MSRPACIIWQPGWPLPKWANRLTCELIVSHKHFPVSQRTLMTWPVSARRVNGHVVLNVAEVLEFAKEMEAAAPIYRQA